MCVQPVPPVTRSNSVEHERRSTVAGLSAKLDEQLVGRPSILKESHPEFSIEEDIHILYQTNKGFAYDYHGIFLRMLNSVDTPPSHWVLKWSHTACTRILFFLIFRMHH